MRKVITRVNSIRSLEIPKLLFPLEAQRLVGGGSCKEGPQKIYRRNRNLTKWNDGLGFPHERRKV